MGIGLIELTEHSDTLSCEPFLKHYILQTIGWHLVLKVLCFWWCLCKVIGNRYSRCNFLGTAIKTFPIIYFEHYEIHYIEKNQNIRYTIKDYKRDVSLCMRVFKEIIKKKTLKKMRKNQKTFFETLLCILSYYSWRNSSQ